MSNSSCLPEFTIKRSSRAKKISLRISRQFGLQIIVPLHINDRIGIEFLKSKQQWVEKNLTLLKKNKSEIVFPFRMELLAVNKIVTVNYHNEKIKQIKIIEAPSGIVLIGDFDNQKNIFEYIQTWLCKQARQFLTSELNRISSLCELPYSRISIRNQASRWGSCSTSKNISLNYKLIFLPYNMVEYVLIHELCHTIHMNHSNRFWQLVKKFCHNYEEIRNRLKSASIYIPAWVNF